MEGNGLTSSRSLSWSLPLLLLLLLLLLITVLVLITTWTKESARECIAPAAGNAVAAASSDGESVVAGDNDDMNQTA